MLTCSSNPKAHYLRDLRTNRPPRPNGSRPLPSRDTPSSLSPEKELPPRASSSLSARRPRDARLDSVDPISRSSSALSHHRLPSEVSSFSSSSGNITTPQASPYRPSGHYSSSTTSIQTAASPGSQYRESGQRWMERQEARSLRSALEEMDLQDEEERLYAAAQDEASELVLSHRTHGFPAENPHAPYRNPDMNHSTILRPHQSTDSHTGSNGQGSQSKFDSSSGTSAKTSRTARNLFPEASRSLKFKKSGSLRRRSKGNYPLPGERISQSIPRHPGRRTFSGDSSKGVFRNPEDHIYEEPEDTDESSDTKSARFGSINAPLGLKPRNSVPHGARPIPNRSSTVPTKDKLNRFDIHKNPPTQSRNPLYTLNTDLPPSVEHDEEKPPMRDGIEIRSDDIRAATTMKLKDRSSKLPMPSMVSDRPGRPIVSFDRNWKPQEAEPSSRSPDSGSRRNVRAGSPEQVDAPRNSTPPAEKPTIPTINIDGEDSTTPEIRVSPLGPPISAMEVPSKSPARALPDPAKYSKGAKTPKTVTTVGSVTGRHQTLTRAGVPTAVCAACDLAISGRTVTACSLRLHPECFSCYHCSTPLECVAFYQEPEAKRKERLENTDTSDEDAQFPRFYCHLDFHELFSPRCKSCKTPIEGEVIIACGAEWHVGHFFCAECGDPFSSTTPFVEKEGFAWCVRCHSRRTASKCQGCKRPVLEDTVITALGGQWHDKCFVCNECNGSFGAEGRFFVRQGKPRFTARGRQIGGPVELAVCEACEAKRLKA